jgi:hypothetical protein
MAIALPGGLIANRFEFIGAPALALRYGRFERPDNAKLLSVLNSEIEKRSKKVSLDSTEILPALAFCG